MSESLSGDAQFFRELLGDGGGGKSAAERKRESLLRHNYNSIEKREPEDMARRRRLEKNPEKWLRWYFPNIFTLPFADGHKAIIDAVISADASGKDMVVAAPRGEGKTNILRYMSVFLILTGRARFVVVGGWQIRAAAEAFSTWCIALTSERLVADYPEFCAPFAESTHASRLPRLHWRGEVKTTGAAIKTARMQIVFPDGRGALAAGSLQGDIKGLNITTTEGASLRPDKLLLDDPQDVDRADDPQFVDDTLHKIDTQWLCLAGPNTRISMMVACTIFAPGDVGESLGKRRNSIFVRIPRVTNWPDGFDTPESQTRALWDKWFDLYCDGQTRQEAVAFYRRNKAAMCKGFKVSWKYRFDIAKGDPDALFAAMVDYYTKGRDAFFSEYQNAPAARAVKYYEITPQCVLARRVPMAENEAPANAIYTVATTDINYAYGLTYEVAAFTQESTCHVLARGVWCEAPLPISQANSNQAVRQRAVRAALELFAQWLFAQPFKLDDWFIDAGGEQFDTVTGFCRSALHAGRMGRAMVGRAGKTYNPFVRSQVGRIRAHTYQCFLRERGRWVCFDADWYKEAAQTSWLAPAGQPGAATIYDGPHREYAQQMCREVLEGKGTLEGRNGMAAGVAYRWQTLPGKHDYLDCHAMAFAGAGFAGAFDIGGEAPHSTLAAPHRHGRQHRRVYNG